MKQQPTSRIHRRAVPGLAMAAVLGIAALAHAGEISTPGDSAARILDQARPASVVFRVQPTPIERQLLARATALHARRLQSVSAASTSGYPSAVLAGAVLNVAIVNTAADGSLSTLCFDSLSDALANLGTAAPAAEER